jgi:hypothetical protein
MPDKEPPCGLGRECFHIHDTFLSVPLSLLERLSMDGPIEDSEGKCPWCNVLFPFGHEHKPDCSWLEARKLIEEAKGA